MMHLSTVSKYSTMVMHGEVSTTCLIHINNYCSVGYWKHTVCRVAALWEGTAAAIQVHVLKSLEKIMCKARRCCRPVVRNYELELCKQTQDELISVCVKIQR